MKRSIYTLTFALLITGSTFVSCKQATNEDEVVVSTPDESNSVMIKSTTQNKDWEAFKIKTDSAINNNDVRIAALKSKMNKTGKAIDSSYQLKIDQLEVKNQQMKIKMDNYKNDANQNWDSFKAEFNHDLNELGDALKNITVDNKK